MDGAKHLSFGTTLVFHFVMTKVASLMELSETHLIKVSLNNLPSHPIKVSLTTFRWINFNGHQMAQPSQPVARPPDGTA